MLSLAPQDSDRGAVGMAHGGCELTENQYAKRMRWLEFDFWRVKKPHLASADRLARTKACHTTNWTYVNKSHLPLAAESWQASYQDRRASYHWPLTKPLTKTSPCICSIVLEGISLKTTSPACQRYQTGRLLFEEPKRKGVFEIISFKATSSACWTMIRFKRATSSEQLIKPKRERHTPNSLPSFKESKLQGRLLHASEKIFSLKSWIAFSTYMHDRHAYIHTSKT